VSVFVWKVNKQQSNSIGCFSSTYQRRAANRVVDRLQQRRNNDGRPKEPEFLGVETNQKITKMVSFSEDENLVFFFGLVLPDFSSQSEYRLS
jgi:hypothetical protein